MPVDDCGVCIFDAGIQILICMLPAFAFQGVQCYDTEGKATARYKKYYNWVFLATIIYSLGVPILFVKLLYHFKDQGNAGDKVVQNALGWYV